LIKLSAYIVTRRLLADKVVLANNGIDRKEDDLLIKLADARLMVGDNDINEIVLPLADVAFPKLTHELGNDVQEHLDVVCEAL